jgi:hypothetical protein
MDHSYIDQLDLAERYLMGKLPAEETLQFEEHFVDCSQCVDRLKTTKALIEGLRVVAREQALEAPHHVRRGFFRYPPYRRSRNQLALAGAALLLMFLLGGLVVSNRIRDSRLKAEQERSAAAKWQDLYEEERLSSSLADQRHLESERKLTDAVAQLRSELESSRKQRFGNADGNYPSATKRARINLPILALSSTRGGEPLPGSIDELVLPPDEESFLISVTLEGETGFVDYRMTVFRGQKRVWRRQGLKPNRYKLLLVELNSTLFGVGEYQVLVEGISGEGNGNVVGNYSFRLLKTP